MSKARERQKQRKQREMVTKRGRGNSQATPEGQFEIPEINIPGGRWLLVIPAAGIILLGVIFALRFINPPETEAPPNAIWLDSDWVYGEQSTEDVIELMETLRVNDIGQLYLYVSSLSADGTWSGVGSVNNRFTTVEAGLSDLIEQIRSVYPSVTLYAWIEVNANSPSYRLDQPQIQNTIANFSERMVTQHDFDGVLLDVKPIFEENDDYIDVLRGVRRAIGFDIDLIVSVPPDITPTGTDLILPSIIEPGTEWSAEYKQRVALIANQIVINVYNSYQTDAINYIEWVSYQVESYVTVLSAIDSGTTIMVSIPNYDRVSQAHDPNVENLEASLDGVNIAINALTEETRPLLAGVAIFTEALPTDAEWRIYNQRIP